MFIGYLIKFFLLRQKVFFRCFKNLSQNRYFFFWVLRPTYLLATRNIKFTAAFLWFRATWFMLLLIWKFLVNMSHDEFCHFEKKDLMSCWKFETNIFQCFYSSKGWSLFIFILKRIYLEVVIILRIFYRCSWINLLLFEIL